jgi:hypothetical protein
MDTPITPPKGHKGVEDGQPPQPAAGSLHAQLHKLLETPTPPCVLCEESFPPALERTIASTIHRLARYPHYHLVLVFTDAYRSLQEMAPESADTTSIAMLTQHYLWHCPR